MPPDQTLVRWDDLTPAQQAVLVELEDTATDRWLAARTLSSLRAGVELRGERLVAGETLPLAAVGLIAVTRPLMGAALYEITDRGTALVEASAGGGDA